MINQDLPLLSVVVETFNAQAGAEVEVALVLDKLAQQTYPQEKIEIYITIDKNFTHMINFLNQNYPAVHQVLIEEPSYYKLKYYGLKAAKGDIVALLDSDCIPSLTWAESIAETIGSGVDFVSGKTRYSKDGVFPRLFSLFSFGDVCNNSKGEANRFTANNVAFSREIVNQLQYDDRRKRNFGSNLIAHELKAKNYKFTYNPKQFVTHFNFGLRFHITSRFRSGYEAVMICNNDTTGVVPEKKYMKFGLLFPFISAARRFVHDIKTLTNNHKDLDISPIEVPFFLAICILIRMYEIIPGLITIVSPNYLKNKYDW
jgi:glycosyltransferase involved in cell wall biosynthesis